MQTYYPTATLFKPIACSYLCHKKKFVFNYLDIL